MVAPSIKPATPADLAAMANRDRLEIVSGEIVQRATRSGEHSLAQAGLVGELYPFSRRAGGAGGPGSGWIVTQIHTLYPGGETYCHDVAGWRRDRMPGGQLGGQSSFDPMSTSRARRVDVVRAEPFEAIELRVGALFGDDD